MHCLYINHYSVPPSCFSLYICTGKIAKWDRIVIVEMVQRRAARFVSQRYHNISSVTDMLRNLQWESLEHRRWKARLTMFYKVQFGLVAVPLPDVVTRAPRERPGHPHQFQTPYCRTNSYRDSFFPLAIVQWNALPSSVACQASLPLFQADLSSLS